RRFKENSPVREDILHYIIDCARLSGSPRNQQSLKFKIVSHSDERKELFKHTAWAGALKDWPGPKKGERPAAYILIFDDLEIAPKASKRWSETAAGIALQSMILAAEEHGLGACTIAAVNRPAITKFFKTSPNLKLLIVLALGEPNEVVKITELKNGNFNYYRDEKGIHYVPKRSLDELII
ncbi:MAG: nitroreductase family protein, partial [Bacteroidota bacterium]|nr:nitroreductase family protein [Bacteroidota bacterium]